MLLLLLLLLNLKKNISIRPKPFRMRSYHMFDFVSSRLILSFSVDKCVNFYRSIYKQTLRTYLFSWGRAYAHIVVSTHIVLDDDEYHRYDFFRGPLGSIKSGTNEKSNEIRLKCLVNP